jgi:hypothetical protein
MQSKAFSYIISICHSIGSPKMPMVKVDLSGDMVLVLHALFHTVYTMLKCNVIKKKTSMNFSAYTV